MICSAAERQIGQHDPPAIILDEVWGMAAIVMVLPWVAVSWMWPLTAFLGFRLFDIVKPPPLKLLARLPAGWGIMADDFGAAAYAIILLWLAHRLIPS
jgi:phosphatidylglycerophosphatase A